MIHRSKGAKLFAVALSVGLLAAACGDDDDDTSSGTTAGAQTTAGGSETTAAPATTAAATTAPAAPKGTIKFAAEQEPVGFNCVYVDSNEAWCDYIIQDLTNATAVRVDPTATIRADGDLVTKIELTSKSPQTVKYTLNPKAVWSDGTPITVEDFKFTWEAQKDCGETSAYKCASDNGYKDIASVAAGGANEVVVTYTSPYADYMALFQPILPKANFTAMGGGDAAKGFNEAFLAEKVDVTKMVSGGPFMVKSYTAGNSVVLVPNPKWYGTPPGVAELIFVFVLDSSQQPSAFANKEVDAGFPQAQTDLVKQIQGLSGVKFEIGFGSFWEHVDFNSTNKILADVNVRKALALAIDRAAIVKALPGQVSDKAVVMNNHIYKPGMTDYKDNGGEYAKVDLAKAKSMLDAAGWVEGSGGIREKGGQKMTLRIAYRDPNPRRKSEAELIQSSLKAVGVDAVIDPKPSFAFLNDGDWDLTIFGWTGGAVLASSESIYTVDGAQNYGKIADPAIADLWAKSNVELDPKARAALVDQIDKLIWAQMHSLPLYQVPEPLFWRDTISGPSYNGYEGPTWSGWTWTVK